MLYDELINIYKKEYNQAFKSIKTEDKNMIIRI